MTNLTFTLGVILNTFPLALLNSYNKHKDDHHPLTPILVSIVLSALVLSFAWGFRILIIGLP
jgi:hypothetical protein